MCCSHIVTLKICICPCLSIRKAHTIDSHELFLHYQYSTVSAIGRPQNLASIPDGNIITWIMHIVVRVFGHYKITQPSTIIAYHGFTAKSSTKLLACKTNHLTRNDKMVHCC